MSQELVQKLRELQGVIARGGITRLPDSETIRRAADALQVASADNLREPTNGTAWRVEWWNESARLMLPAGSKLDSFQSYRNGTLMFTIKRIPAPGATHGGDKA